MLIKIFIYPGFFSSEGDAIDEKMQVDKSNYLNTYGARLTGLEAQIRMTREHLWNRNSY